MNGANYVVGKVLPGVLEKRSNDFESNAFETHPSFSAPTEGDQEVVENPATSQSTSTEPIVLPGRIANALVNVYDGLDDFNLFENHRRVLSCLIRFGVRLSDVRAHIFMKKSTIASKLKLNEATVYRSLTALEEKGLIRRAPQDRSAKLKVIGQVFLTDLALRRLGLATPVASQDSKTIEISNSIDIPGHLAGVQDVNSDAFKQSSSKRQPTRGAFETIDGKAVPAELAWLPKERGLSLSGLFKLMKLARTEGKRLSDVAECVRESLNAMKGRAVFAYLHALTKKDADFSFQASQRRDASALEARKSMEGQQRAENIAKVRSRVGTTYRTPDARLLTVEESGFHVRCAYSMRTLGSLPFSKAEDAVKAIVDEKWPRDAGGVRTNEANQAPQANNSKPRSEAWSVLGQTLALRFGRGMSTT